MKLLVVLLLFVLPTIGADSKVRKQVLITGYWRSGANIVGQLFNRDPTNRTFYLNEPLEDLLPNTISVSERATFLARLMQCRLADVPELVFYNEHLKLSRSTQLFVRCLETGFGHVAKCLPQLIQSCLSSETVVVKDAGLRHSVVKALFDPPLNLDSVKVVQVVRDPRSLLVSQHVVSKPNGSNLTVAPVKWRQEASTLCRQLVDDMVALDELGDETVLTVHYEDLATRLLPTTQTLFRFLNLPLRKGMMKTRSATSRPNSWVNFDRSAQSAASRWRTTLSLAEITQIDEACREAGFYRYFKQKHEFHKCHQSGDDGKLTARSAKRTSNATNNNKNGRPRYQQGRDRPSTALNCSTTTPN